MNYLGDYHSGAPVLVYFNTFDSNDPAASVTVTDLAVGDIHVHRDDGLTQRASTSGYTLDIDVDGIVGCHLIKIDTADNATADFWVPGHDYGVRLEGITVDAAALNPWVAHFSIENRYVAGLMARSNIATLASQTSFTLASGEASADDDAYNGCVVVVTDVATMIQKCVGYISDYTGSTRTITLSADPGIFTMAAGDHVAIIAGANVASWNSVLLATTNPLPNAAADAAGGLPISDAGGLDLDAMNANINTIDDFIDTEIADIQARLPAALVGARMDSNVSALNNNNPAAVRLALSADVIIPGTVDTGSFAPTTTEFEADDITEATADHFNGRIVIFTSGALDGQATDITDYALAGSNGHFTVTALTSAPGNNDSFIIV